MLGTGHDALVTDSVDSNANGGGTYIAVYPQANHRPQAGQAWQDNDLVFATAVGTPSMRPTCAGASAASPRPLA